MSIEKVVSHDDGYEYEPEDDEQPISKELLKFVAFRERLKESIRKRMRKEEGYATDDAASCEKLTHTLRKGKPAFAFGPSQIVISQRVIQELKPFMNNPDLAATITKSNRVLEKKKKSGSSSPHAPSRPQFTSLPRVMENAGKNKVEMIKNTRDYSFLLSEDGEVPPPSKDPLPGNVSAPKSDPRPVQLLSNGKHVVNRGGPGAPHAHGVRKPMPASSQSNTKGSGSGPPLPPKGVPSRTTSPQLPSGEHRKSLPPAQPSALNKSSVQRKVVTKQPLPSSKNQMRPPPPKPSAQDVRPKPKPKRRLDDDDDDEDESDGANAISIIRNMFGYNPSKFRDDDDINDMEAGFHDILREEKKSAKIARQEDQEQLRLIEEEERRERMQAKKKQKKDGQ